MLFAGIFISDIISLEAYAILLKCESLSKLFIITIIANMKCGKAAGLDGISVEHLQYSHDIYLLCCQGCKRYKKMLKETKKPVASFSLCDVLEKGTIDFYMVRSYDT